MERRARAGAGIVARRSDREGFAVYVSLDGGSAGRSTAPTDSVRLGSVDDGGFLRGALSADGSLLCLEHAEHGDLIHPALRVIDPRSGATVGEQLDEGMSLVARCWSPVAGDQRLACDHERDGDDAARRSGISRRATSSGSQLDLEGEVFVATGGPTAPRCCS